MIMAREQGKRIRTPRQEPEIIPDELLASVLLTARKTCRCLGRGYNIVEFGPFINSKRVPIQYGVPFFRTREYCSCVKQEKK